MAVQLEKIGKTKNSLVGRKIVFKGRQNEASVQPLLQNEVKEDTLIDIPSHLLNRPQPKGLVNLGNTCFLNATLQCLANTPLLTHLAKTHTLQCTASSCYICLYTSHTSSTNPRPIVAKLKAIGKQFRAGRQEDAHEFLRLFLDKLDVQLPNHSNASPRPRRGLVQHVFQGTLLSSITCKACLHASLTYAPFLDISLDIRHVSSIDKEIYTAKEILATTYTCERCKQKTLATKQTTVHDHPQTLTLHLKRFSATKKISKSVLAPLTFTLAGVEYELVGQITHEGGSLHSGHYTACVRVAGGWVRCDDESVSRVGVDAGWRDKGYVLFYQRKQATCRLVKKTKDNDGMKRGLGGDSQDTKKKVKIAQLALVTPTVASLEQSKVMFAKPSLINQALNTPVSKTETKRERKKRVRETNATHQTQSTVEVKVNLLPFIASLAPPSPVPTPPQHTTSMSLSAQKSTSHLTAITPLTTLTKHHPTPCEKYVAPQQAYGQLLYGAPVASWDQLDPLTKLQHSQHRSLLHYQSPPPTTSTPSSLTPESKLDMLPSLPTSQKVNRKRPSDHDQDLDRGKAKKVREKGMREKKFREGGEAWRGVSSEGGFKYGGEERKGGGRRVQSFNVKERF